MAHFLTKLFILVLADLFTTFFYYASHASLLSLKMSLSSRTAAGNRKMSPPGTIEIVVAGTGPSTVAVIKQYPRLNSFSRR